MRYLKQFTIILTISLLGEVLHYIIPLPVPASIYGLLLMLAALLTGVVKRELGAGGGGVPGGDHARHVHSGGGGAAGGLGSAAAGVAARGGDHCGQHRAGDGRVRAGHPVCRPPG